MEESNQKSPGAVESNPQEKPVAVAGEKTAPEQAPFLFTTLIESKLLEGCIRGDRSSQKAFFARYSSFVMGMCYRYSSGEKDAVSMCVSVFKDLFGDMRHAPKNNDLERWIAGKVIWSAIAYLHRDRRTFFIAKTTRYEESKQWHEEMDEAALSHDARKEIYLAALQALTPSFRILYNLTYIDEIPKNEILSQLQMAAETYKAELEEARFQFKKQLNAFNHEYRQQRGSN